MKVGIAAALPMLFGVPALHAQADQRAADSASIVGVVANWERAWTELDATLAAQDYAADADWTNAFGMRRIGRDSIEALLTTVFQLPFVVAGSTEYEYHDLRFLAEDVAVLRSRAIRTGQELPDGTVEEPRRINHLRVLVRREGRWQIASHLIGDERTPGNRR
ncbi:MAG: SgcJ/EcaC family oxidoreductase [Gemmatimonadales bacterium]